jgi:FkbM family methyltransferase
MKNLIKNTVKSSIKFIIKYLGKTVVGRYVYRQLIDDAMSQTQTTMYKDIKLNFTVPNTLNKYRIDTYSTKEPETLEWIDAISEGSILWDIGANVGLYSCYAAKARNCQVFAFEPSVFNLELLARNLFINGLSEQVTIIPLPLSDKLSINCLNMSTTEWGGALSTFGESYGQDGNSLEKVFTFNTIGLSMTDLISHLNLPMPDYIKMDVDGIEHLILKGGDAVLKNVKGILIEINEDFDKQIEDSTRYLSEAGLVFKEKRHAEEFNGSASFNQIWTR